MKALLSSAVLVLAATAMPVSAASQGHAPRTQSGLPPGCSYVMGVLICLDMPIGPPVVAPQEDGASGAGKAAKGAARK